MFVFVFIGMRLGWTNASSKVDNQQANFINATSEAQISDWQNTDEWQILKDAINKDKESIDKAGKVVGVHPRIITSLIVAEQMRLFFSERALFESYFAPMKVLGNQSQFSWGVLGLKENTAKEIEAHLSDTTSPFYIGPEYEHLLDFKTADHDTERFERITNKKSRYYTYLYAGLYIKQIETQWLNAGYPINDKPGVLATLYNIGFVHSKPNANPQIGGAILDLDKYTITFGKLAEEFYNSNEMLDEFSR